MSYAKVNGYCTAFYKTTKRLMIISQSIYLLPCDIYILNNNKCQQIFIRNTVEFIIFQNIYRICTIYSNTIFVVLNVIGNVNSTRFSVALTILVSNILSLLCVTYARFYLNGVYEKADTFQSFTVILLVIILK